MSGVKMRAQQTTASLQPGCSLYKKVQLLQLIAQELPQMVQLISHQTSAPAGMGSRTVGLGILAP